MEITGKIIHITEKEVFKNDFTKQTIVIETFEKYAQKIPVEFIKDNIDHLHALQIGDSVTVSINIRGREYQGKYFSSIEGWKVKSTIKPKPESNDLSKSEHDNDLPF